LGCCFYDVGRRRRLVVTVRGVEEDYATL